MARADEPDVVDSTAARLVTRFTHGVARLPASARRGRTAGASLAGSAPSRYELRS
jgi:hypothetical protein